MIENQFLLSKAKEAHKMKLKITLQDIKVAMSDEKFRNLLGEDYKDDITKYLGNPGCGCNHPIYVKIMKNSWQVVNEYYKSINSDKELLTENDAKNFQTAPPPMVKNEWHIINCKVNELEAKLKEFGDVRTQISIARWEDEVTVVVNSLGRFF